MSTSKIGGILLVVLVYASGASAQVLSRPPANTRSVALPVMERVTNEDPARFACAHTGRACEADWIKAVAWALHQVDQRFGLNGRRGDPNNLSWDVITYLLDPSNPRMVAAWDVCGSCGIASATLRWDEITNYTTIGQPGTAVWIKPEPVGGTGSGGGGTSPTPTPPPTPPAPDLTAVFAKIDALAATIATLTAKLDTLAGVAVETRDAAKSAEHDARELNARPPVVAPPFVMPCMRGSVYGRGVRFCPE